STITGNGTFAHDLWPWYMIGNAYAGFSFFTSAPHGYVPRVLLQSDLFANVAYNETVFYDFQTQLYGPIGTNWLFDTNIAPYLPGVTLGTLEIDSSTFLGTPLGRQHQFPPGDVVLGANGVTATLTHDVFANSVANVVAPKTYQNGSYFTPLYAEDVIVAGGSTVLTDDWFLGLSNLTAPIGENSGAQGAGAAPTVSITGCHFFYAPTSLESFVPAFGYAAAAETPAGSAPMHWLGGTFSTNSSMTYEVPIDTNASLSFVSGTYLWNLTTTQTNGYIVGSWSTPNVYPWVVDPSVSLVSGALSVEYAGMGGPQPAVLWEGHRYDVNVSSSAVEVHADSSTAPGIFVAFAGTPGATYEIQAENGGTGLVYYSQNVVADPSGIVAVGFSPGAMPLTSIFFPSFLGFPSTAPGFSLTSVVLGLPFYAWIAVIIAVGAMVAWGAGRLRAT
ncbi:MAG: hypothetical protein L3J91_00090, partial [Thermoplasmata archaeon]|nr:hypothetical protein [Thermoplasmata archaeon]